MKIFILKTIWFFLTILVIVSGIFGITFMLASKRASNIKLDQDIHTLICGDSHTKTALNDSIIPNALNIAHSSEHYMYTYSVLKTLLANNPQVTTVILGMSYHNLSSFYDDYVFVRSKTKYMYPRYATVLTIQALPLIMSHNFEGLVVDFKDIYHGVYRHVNAEDLQDFSFIGWFYKSNRKNKNDTTISRAIGTHYFKAERELYGISTHQLSFLAKISQLCNKMNVRLILINCPLSPDYTSRVPEVFLEYYNDMKSEYGQYILDVHDFHLPDSCWGDGDHLNLSGSIVFSNYLKRALDSIAQ